jgi:hypothetical protein
MTTIDRDSCANLGILSQFDAMFRPQAAMLGRQNPPGHDDPEDEPEDEEAAEREREERGEYRAIYEEDHDDTPTSNYHRDY